MDTKTGNIYTPEMMEAFKKHAETHPEIIPQTKDMVEMKLTGRLDPRFQDPLFKTVFNLKRRFPIG